MIKQYFNGPKIISQKLNKRFYNTIIERQTNFHPINMDTSAIINIINTMQLNYELNLPQSLIFLQITLRILHIPVNYLIRRYVVNDRDFMIKHQVFYQKYIFNDLERDANTYRIKDSKQIQQMKTHYSPSKLMSTIFTVILHLYKIFIQGYTQYILYKSLSLMSNYPQYFTNINPENLYWLQYDPTFILPIGVMLLNYLLLNKSEHPFLINMRNRWTPISQMLFIIYGSCLSIVLPQTYLISYVAFGMTHLILKGARKRIQKGSELSGLNEVFKK